MQFLNNICLHHVYTSFQRWDKRQKALFWSFSALQNSALGECPSLDDSIITHFDSLVVPFFVSFFHVFVPLDSRPPLTFLMYGYKKRFIFYAVSLCLVSGIYSRLLTKHKMRLYIETHSVKTKTTDISRVIIENNIIPMIYRIALRLPVLSEELHIHSVFFRYSLCKRFAYPAQ